MAKQQRRKLADYLELDYPVELVIDREQGGYFARHPDLPGCSAEGETADEAVENLAESRTLWIETRLESGFPVPEPPDSDYGGRISLRISSGLHASLARAATRQGLSVNQLLTSVLSEYVGGTRTEEAVVNAVSTVNARIDALTRKMHEAALNL